MFDVWSQVEDAMLMYDKQTQRHRGTILQLVPCVSRIGVNYLLTYLLQHRNEVQQSFGYYK